MPTNVQLSDANFSLGPDAGFYYSCDYSEQRLIKVEADGSFVGGWPVARSTFRNPVTELHYDGTFFWTLEDLPSNLGVVVKRWRLHPFETVLFPDAVVSEFRWIDEITLLNAPRMKWSSSAFAVEHYHRVLGSSYSQGVSTIRLNSVANINVGDTLYLGPSSIGDPAFTGNEEEIIVTGINPTTKDITFSKAGGLENEYSADDPVDFVKTIFVFSDHRSSGLEDNQGALFRVAYPGPAFPVRKVVAVDTGGAYNAVSAADFHEGTLGWVKAFQILELDITNPTLDLTDSLEANLMEDDYKDVIEVYDLIADLGNSQYLKLQDRETNESAGTLTTTTYPGNTYNFQAQVTGPVVNSTALSFDTRFAEQYPTSDRINITVHVRDQYNFPVLGETVNFSAAVHAGFVGTIGTFAPDAIITNSSGIGETVYTPSSTPTDLILDITAEVQ
jgi:hypothetical protein